MEPPDFPLGPVVGLQFQPSLAVVHLHSGDFSHPDWQTCRSATVKLSDRPTDNLIVKDF